MFGILFFLFIALCGAGAAIWKSIDDVRIYKDTLNSDDGYYTDSRGTHRQVGTGNAVAILSDDQGDEIMYTPRGKVIKNITEEQRHRFIEAIQKAIENGETNQTAYWCDLREYHENEWSGIKGNRYKDISSRNIYIVRSFNVDGMKYTQRNRISGMKETITKSHDIHFYMDIRNGHLIRPTDGYIRLSEEYSWQTEKHFLENNESVIQEFIKDFNQKQDTDRRNNGITGFEDHFFFNDNRSTSDSFLNMQWVDYKKNNSLKLEKEKTEVTWSH